ncbi:CYFA0S01e04148g1_1 [Cyberlindnera fabianii]|uniref:Translation machinery-associated protein 22 n=1 Tax=Cyberlindnera fabianii TaxID=36022 RepID=A0A061AHY8_CYBFA|nr:Translation machinery-associated protein 22 [Cyberlindnera fabianii]CDR36749.1 CYFA0S01e04148g1_1 [Cyberlindnera fabianii]
MKYCEFGATFKKCKVWLEEEEPELFEKLYSEDSLANQTSTLSLEKQEKIEKDLQKKQAKEEAKQERELQKKLQSKVVLKRIERTKRKHAIAVSGLEVFDIDMKKLAKTFASKFATGCSVTKGADKKEEIVVQGDVGDAIEEYITGLLKEKGLNDIKVEQIEEKKKKKASTTPAIPPQ